MSGVAALKQVVSPSLKNNTVLLEHVPENTNTLKEYYTKNLCSKRTKGVCPSKENKNTGVVVFIVKRPPSLIKNRSKATQAFPFGDELMF